MSVVRTFLNRIEVLQRQRPWSTACSLIETLRLVTPRGVRPAAPPPGRARRPVAARGRAGLTSPPDRSGGAESPTRPALCYSPRRLNLHTLTEMRADEALPMSPPARTARLLETATGPRKASLRAAPISSNIRHERSPLSIPPSHSATVLAHSVRAADSSTKDLAH